MPITSMRIKLAVSFLAVFTALSAGFSATPKSNRKKAKLTQGTNIAMALSPDGKIIAFDLQGTLWTLPAAGGKAKAITDEYGDVRQPAWSPDGKQIVFQSYRDGDWHLWTVNANGSNLKQITSGAFDDREPHWSPDGKSIVFASDRAGNYDIWKLELASGKLEQLTRDAANDYNPAWSPDGNRIAFVSERTAGRGIWLIENANSAERREVLFSKSNSTLAAPSWSATGKNIVYQASDRARGITELWLKPATSTQEARRLSADGEDVFPFRAAWLSDNEFLYTANGQIKKTSTENPQRTAIAFEATVKLNRPIYARKKRDFDSMAARPVRGIAYPAVSPDGNRVAFTALGDLWIQEAGKKAERVTKDVFTQAHPRWSPDGKKLVFVSDKLGSMNVWMRDLASGEERVLAKPVGESGYPTWSPDGKKVAFVVGGGILAGRVQVLDLESGKITSPTTRSGQPTPVSWSADSQTVAFMALNPNSTRFREGLYELLLAPVDGGAPRSLVPIPNRSLAYAELSPNGKMLAFVEDGRLSIAPLNERGELAGTPRRVSEELCDWPSWTGDSKSIVYLSLDRLKKVNIETGRSEEIAVQIEWKPEQPTGTTVVHASRMFDGRSADYRNDVDIIIEGNRILDIRPHNDAQHIGKVIDATGKSVIPGLFEMHGHQSLTVGEKLGRTWLAFGITSTREPGTDPYDAVERRESWTSGQRPGPRLFFSGRLMDGRRVYYAIAEELASDSHVDLALERARLLEFDMIKTYVRLPDLKQQKILAAAHKMGVPTSSHEIYPAAAYGMDAVEHNGATSRRGYSPKTSLLGRSYDDVIQLLAASQMNYTPTLILSSFGMVVADNPAILKNKQVAAFYSDQMAAMTSRLATSSNPALRESAAAQGKTVLSVMKAGGRVTAGTDSPIVPYGISLQLELHMLVRAGFTPAEALRSATLWSAEAVGVGNDLGSIERGKLADLVIVDGDPLRKIEDALNVVITIKNGKAYTINDLLTAPK